MLCRKLLATQHCFWACMREGWSSWCPVLAKCVPTLTGKHDLRRIPSHHNCTLFNIDSTYFTRTRYLVQSCSSVITALDCRAAALVGVLGSLFRWRCGLLLVTQQLTTAVAEEYMLIYFALVYSTMYCCTVLIICA